MIPTRTHGAIDYLAAIALGGLAASGRRGSGTRAATAAAGAFHAGYSALTDYEGGAVAAITMRQHLALDAAGALALCGAGLLMRRERPRDRALLVAAGLAELAVVALSSDRPRSGPGQGSGPIGRLVGGFERGRGIDVTYPPLDTPKPVADGIWMVDSGPISVVGLALPVRMTVLRLPGGELLLHSPTRFTAALARELDGLGRVRHLVAPNIAHWTFLKPWQDRYPDATTWGAPGLGRRSQVRRAGVRVDRELSDAAPPEWDGITVLPVPGGFGFREFALFHQASGTLVLTDLVENLEAGKLPAPARVLARLAGVLAPDGRAPAQLRAVFRLKRDDAARAAARLLDLGPERVLFSHGRWFERNGTAQLRRSLRWLLG